MSKRKVVPKERGCSDAEQVHTIVALGSLHVFMFAVAALPWFFWKIMFEPSSGALVPMVVPWEMFRTFGQLLTGNQEGSKRLSASSAPIMTRILASFYDKHFVGFHGCHKFSNCFNKTLHQSSSQTYPEKRRIAEKRGLSSHDWQWF